MSAGYTHCQCATCFEIIISPRELCDNCQSAGCEIDGCECRREDFGEEDEDAAPSS